MFAFCVYTPHEFRIDWFLVYSLLTVQFSKSFLGCRFKRRLVSYHRGKMFVNNFFWRSFSWRCVSRTACLVYLSEPWLSTPFFTFFSIYLCLFDLQQKQGKSKQRMVVGKVLWYLIKEAIFWRSHFLLYYTWLCMRWAQILVNKERNLCQKRYASWSWSWSCF